MKIITLVSSDFEENTYLLIDGNNAVVIDPGVSLLEIQSFLASHKATIRYILLTHGHYDHILAAQQLNAPIYAHENEEKMLKDPDLNLSARIIKPSLSLNNINTYKGSMHKLDTFDIFHTPGHSAGSVVIKEGNDLFTGDTLFLDTVGRTDVPTGDSKQLRQSLKVFDSLDKGLMCYPGHGGPFLLGAAYAVNYFLKKNY
jgi:hydroxyacylglutathione hydrolase